MTYWTRTKDVILVLERINKMPKLKYGDKTAKALDNYIKDYKIPTGRTRTGIVASYRSMKNNFDTMNKMQLRESDPFFHCKANYEATFRGGVVGGSVADVISDLKEVKDVFVTGYPIKDSLRDQRANLRGKLGALDGKSLRETCPTHHTKYK